MKKKINLKCQEIIRNKFKSLCSNKSLKLYEGTKLIIKNYNDNPFDLEVVDGDKVMALIDVDFDIRQNFKSICAKKNMSISNTLESLMNYYVNNKNEFNLLVEKMENK